MKFLRVACLAGLYSFAAFGPAAAEPIRLEAAVVVNPGLSLAGTLTTPDNGRPRAVVLLVQGTGPHTRDQVISEFPMFAALAEALAERGIASYRFDNAGVGASTGKPAENFLEREGHVRAALAMLQADAQLRGLPIGVFGHSEGALIAIRLARPASKAPSFFLLLGAPARRGREVWLDQQADPARWREFSADRQARVREGFAAAADAAIANDRTALELAFAQLNAVVGLSPAEAMEIAPGFIARMLSSEMRTFLAYDPAQSIRALATPTLALWGAADDLTAPETSVAAFRAAMNPGAPINLQIIPGEDHFFMQGDGLAPGQHAPGVMRLSPALPSLIDAWLQTSGAAP